MMRGGGIARNILALAAFILFLACEQKPDIKEEHLPGNRELLKSCSLLLEANRQAMARVVNRRSQVNYNIKLEEGVYRIIRQRGSAPDSEICRRLIERK